MLNSMTTRSKSTKTFFSQLEKSRAELAKPMFFLIGNHDYLATGNQIDPENGIIGHSTQSTPAICHNLQKSSGIFAGIGPKKVVLSRRIFDKVLA